MKNNSQNSQAIAKPAKHAKSRTVIVFEIIIYSLVAAFWFHFVKHL